jgi:hypothetical protein
MSTFAVAAFHESALPLGARRVAATIWIRAAGLGSDGVDVALTVWTPAGASISALREIAPAAADRLVDCVRADERTARIEAGRWLDGVHEFELEVALPEGSPGDELLATRIGVLAEGERVASALVAVTWTEVAPGDAPPGEVAEPAGTAAVASADLPTGASPEPRHMGGADAGAAAACAGCGEVPDDGDRYCEGCGRELAAG